MMHSSFSIIRFMAVCGAVAGIAIGFSALPTGALWAAEGAIEEGTGFSMFGTESIKGVDDAKIEKDPVCDRSRRPKIKKVEPDEAAPGHKIVITGENFGTKECFHGVAFSATGSAPIQYTFVNDTTIEAVVPEARAGMSFIDIVAGGGNARSKGFLIKAK